MTGLRASVWHFAGTRVTDSRVPQVMRQVSHVFTRLSKGSHVTSLLAAHIRMQIRMHGCHRVPRINYTVGCIS